MSSSPLSLAVSQLPVSPPSWYSSYLTDRLFPRVLSRLPRSIHPNVFTYLNAFSCVLLFVISLYSRSIESSLPLVCLVLRLFGVFLVFFSLLLDCLDGMQARRTGQCSKFGEFLDHSLDALNCVIFSAVMLLLIEPDSISVIISLLGSAGIYHSQAALYRYSHRMIDPPVNGMEAQTMLCVALTAFSVLFYFIPRVDPLVPWLVLAFAIGGNIGQFQNTNFLVGLLRRLGRSESPEFSSATPSGSILLSHARAMATHSAYCLLFLYYSIDRSLFFVMFLCLSYRINGRYVLVTILYQKCLALPEAQRRELYIESEFEWNRESLLWIIPIAAAANRGGWTLTAVVALFCCRQLALNWGDLQRYRAPLMDNGAVTKSSEQKIAKKSNAAKDVK